MSFVDKFWENFDNRVEYKNEFDNISYSAIKKPFGILKREMPLLLESISTFKFEFGSMLTGHRIADMLARIEKNSNYYSEIHNDPEKLKIWNDFQDALHELCRNIDRERNAVYEAFMEMKQKDPLVGDIRKEGDIRFKALEIVLNKPYTTSKISYMASAKYKTFPYLTYKQLLKLKEEMETLDNTLQDINNAIFNHKKKSAYLWSTKLNNYVIDNRY